MLLKSGTQYARKFEKLISDHKARKAYVFIPIPKKGNAKERSNYRIIVLTSHASKVMFKILQNSLQHVWTKDQGLRCTAGFRKGRGNRDQIASVLDHIKSKRIPEKIYTSAWLTMLKTLTVRITTNCGKFLEMGMPDQLTCLLRNLYAGSRSDS